MSGTAWSRSDFANIVLERLSPSHRKRLYDPDVTRIYTSGGVNLKMADEGKHKHEQQSTFILFFAALTIVFIGNINVGHGSNQIVSKSDVFSTGISFK